MADLGKLLLIVDGVLVLIGAVLLLAGRFNLPLGRLPGDIVYRGKHTVFYSPLATSIVTSVVLLPAFALTAPALTERHDTIDINGLVRRAAANHKAREVLRNDYTYLAHCVWSSSGPRTKNRRPYTADFEIMFVEGEQYMRQIRYNNQPLPPDQEKRQIALMEAFARARREAKGRPAGLPAFYTAFELPIAQLPDAFNLRLQSRQRLDGRDVYVIEALPRDNRESADADQEHARHFKMKLWLDPEEAQIVKIEGEVVKDIVLTGIPVISDPVVNETTQVRESQRMRFLDKPGSIIGIEWTKLGDGAWVPKHAYSKIQERRWLDLPHSDSSTLWREIREWSYSNYKKFRVKSTIVP